MVILKRFLLIRYTKIIAIALFFIGFSCKSISDKKPILIEAKLRNFVIFKKYLDKSNAIRSIEIPIELKINNTSDVDFKFLNVIYDYKNTQGGVVLLFDKKNKNQISNYQEKTVISKETKVFIVFTSHYVDTISKVQSFLKNKDWKNNSLEIDLDKDSAVKSYIETLVKGDTILLKRIHENGNVKSIKSPVKT